jgi:endo-1,4-beta-xylanase
VNPRIYIGGALTPNFFSETAYKTLAAQELNCLTPENAMKWSSIEGSKGQLHYSEGDQLVSFAQQNGMKVRGHTLVWYKFYKTILQE